jgi:outer membrane protein OmpA-like peptidoglycan-associated protein
MRMLIFLLPMVALLAVSPASADEPLTSDAIVQKLLPSHKTRGFDAGAALTAEDQAFINGLKAKTRQIVVEERTELTEIVKKDNLPALDLEIYFDFDSSVITPQAVLTLVKLGQALASEQLRTASFLIGGHTDAQGAADYNQRLSEARAAAVKAFLVSNFQLAAQQLISVGYGKEDLKNPGDPQAPENRRVTIVNLVSH